MRIMTCGDKLPRDEESLKEQSRVIRMLDDSNKKRNVECPCCGSQLAWNARDVHLTDDPNKSYIYCPFDGEQIQIKMVW